MNLNFLTGISNGVFVMAGLMALAILKQAFTTDVAPVLAVARERGGGAIDPIATYRASGYRRRKAEERPARMGVAVGIV